MSKRILMVAYSDARHAVSAVRSYIKEHQLDWVLRVVQRERGVSQLKKFDYTQENQQFDGLIGWLGYSLPLWWADNPKPAAVALCSRKVMGPKGILFMPDDEAIGQLAARHYWELGYRQVATMPHKNQPTRKKRYEAFAQEATRLGMSYHIIDGSKTGLDGEEATAAALRQAPHPLGLFCHQDQDATFYIDFCTRHKISIPQDVAILGVDNVPRCDLVVPTLSSIDLNHSATARLMAIHMHRMLSGQEAENQNIAVPPLRVQVRESTTLYETGDDLVDSARQYILSHPERRNQVEDLAERFHISASQLRRRFAAALRISPADFARQARIRHAQDLLLTQTVPLDQIAKQCGFNGRTGLWQMFKNAGLPSPDSWRQMHLDN